MMGGASDLASIIDTFYDNSLDNIGNHDSFVWYGPRWACAATAPSRGFKTWITEGGIRCPCLVRYPPLTAQGGMTHAFTTVMDILPTVLELATVPPVGDTFCGRQVAPVRGKSWVRHLSQLEDAVHDDNETFTGWELFGARAIRRGAWKAVWQPEPRGKDDWELYNVEDDPGETDDRSSFEHEILRQLISDWEQYFAETGMFDFSVKFGVTSG